MPLTPIGRVYKNFPSFMADRVTQHARKRAETYRKPREDETDDQEILGIYKRETLKKKSNSQSDSPKENDAVCSKRPRTPMKTDDKCTDSDSENSSPSPRSAGLTTSEPDKVPSRTSSSNSSRGVTPTKDLLDKMKLNSRTPTPTSGGEDQQLISTFHFLPRPRMLRSSSKASVSIDNVDLWESDSESDQGYAFDKISDVVINPRQTYDLDLSQIRRSRSPVNTESPKSVQVSQSLTGMKREKTPSRINHSGITKKSFERENVPRSKPRMCASTHIHYVYMPNPQKSSELPTQHVHRPKTAIDVPILKERKINPLRAFAVRDDIEVGYSTSGGVPVHLPVQICESRSKKRTPVTPDGRKVKFNNMVTVTDGEYDTLDVLRSSRNSAQMYKQKYLGTFSPRNTTQREGKFEQTRPPEYVY